mgnify:FL=1
MNDPMEAFYEFDKSIDQVFCAILPAASKAIPDLYKQLEKILDGMCLVSFSDTYQFLPMWAYYATNFAGMCLEFDAGLLEVGDFRGEPLLEVTYDESPTAPISIFALDKLTIQEAGRFLSRKQKQWQHEREWRYITGEGGRRGYLDDALRRIYLGPRVAPRYKLGILDALRNRPVEILQGRISRFELAFDVVQEATPLPLCERVGAGVFDQDTVLSDSEKDLRTLLGASYDRLLAECKLTAQHPNTESIMSIGVSDSDPSTWYFWNLYKLRSGREIHDKRYFDRDMRLVGRKLAKP